jgi:hypothetical protein
MKYLIGQKEMSDMKMMMMILAKKMKIEGRKDWKNEKEENRKRIWRCGLKKKEENEGVYDE